MKKSTLRNEVFSSSRNDLLTLPRYELLNATGISTWGTQQWIRWGIRKHNLRKMPQYDILNSLKISPLFKKNSLTNTYTFGFTASICF